MDSFFNALVTRPVSIVSSANRLMASIFRLALERVAAGSVSILQQGFVVGRSILKNVVDIDCAAHKVAVKFKNGFILPLNIKTAFPNISQSYLWDSLWAIAIPSKLIAALKVL